MPNYSSVPLELGPHHCTGKEWEQSRAKTKNEGRKDMGTRIEGTPRAALYAGPAANSNKRRLLSSIQAALVFQARHRFLAALALYTTTTLFVGHQLCRPCPNPKPPLALYTVINLSAGPQLCRFCPNPKTPLALYTATNLSAGPQLCRFCPNPKPQLALYTATALSAGPRL